MEEALHIADLGPAAAAAAAASGPGCLDCAQFGGSLWVAVCTAHRSMQVVHAPLDGGAAGGSVHSVVVLPEAAALVQLGVPSAAHDAAAPGAAVLLVVGASCRVWAFHLLAHPPGAAAATAEVAADAAAAASVSLAQPRCPARHQLAAAVAWEHLCHWWEPAAAAQPGSAAGGIAPLSLAGLQEALRQLHARSQPCQQQQAPLLVHSVASWVCQPPASAAAGGADGTASMPAAIPPDATAAAVVSLVPGPEPTPGNASSGMPRLACSSRFVQPAPSNGAAAAGQVGYLLVATAGGQLLSLPIGAPCSIAGGSGLQAPAASACGRLPLAICCAGSRICFLPLPMQHDHRLQHRELLLLAESGRLVPAEEAGLCGTSVLAAGSGPGATDSSSAGHVFAAVVQLVGAQAAAAAGSCLCYLPQPLSSSSGSNSSSELRHLDAATGLAQEVAAKLPIRGIAGGRVAMLASATSLQPHHQQHRQHRLVLLTEQGALVTTELSSTGAVHGQNGSSPAPPVQQLEANIQVGGCAACALHRLLLLLSCLGSLLGSVLVPYMYCKLKAGWQKQSPLCWSPTHLLQELLGAVAELSTQQERMGQQLLSLDGRIGGVAASIPAAQAAVPGASAAFSAMQGIQLHCTVRPQALLSRVVGSGGSRGSGITEEALALEVSLLNTSRLAVAGDWTVLLHHTNSPSSLPSNRLALAAPLGQLPPGSEWRLEFQVPLHSLQPTCSCGQLRVLLCRHSTISVSDASCGSSGGCVCVGPCGSSLLMLHSLELDMLHQLQLSQQAAAASSNSLRLPQGTRPPALPLAAFNPGTGNRPTLQAAMLLQLPQSLLTVQPPSAAALLQQLMEQGLSTMQLADRQRCEDRLPAGSPSPALRLLLPPSPQTGSGGSMDRASTTGILSAGSTTEAHVSLSAQLIPAATSGYQQLLQVGVAVTDTAGLLACHHGLCRRMLMANSAAVGGQPARQPPTWLQLPGGAALLPAPSAGSLAGSAAAGADEAELESALVQLRQLRAAAMQLRGAAAENRRMQAIQQVAPPAASERQLRRQEERHELQRLVVHGRQAGSLVPLVMF